MDKKIVEIKGVDVELSREPIRFGDDWVYICPINGIYYGDNGQAVIKNYIPDSMGWFEKLHDKDNYWKVIKQ